MKAAIHILRFMTIGMLLGVVCLIYYFGLFGLIALSFTGVVQVFGEVGSTPWGQTYLLTMGAAIVLLFMHKEQAPGFLDTISLKAFQFDRRHRIDTVILLGFYAILLWAIWNDRSAQASSFGA